MTRSSTFTVKLGVSRPLAFPVSRCCFRTAMYFNAAQRLHEPCEVFVPAHGLCPSKLNSSLTSTFKILANFSKPATDGAFTPRSTRLINSTEQPTASASCSWVNFRALRSVAIRWPSFRCSTEFNYQIDAWHTTELNYGQGTKGGAGLIIHTLRLARSSNALLSYTTWPVRYGPPPQVPGELGCRVTWRPSGLANHQGCTFL